jgi:flagella basal body P-ring formation protein FlgA
MKLLWLSLLPALGVCECFAIDGPRILGRHLAAASPEFAAVPAEQEFGFTPSPGRIRVIEPPELLRWARQAGLSIVPRQSVCITQRTEMLDEAKIVAALRQVLQGPPGLQLSVIDFSKWPVPAGTLDFPTAASGRLRPDRKDGSRLFRGVVRFGDRLTLPVWARVQIRVRQNVVVARQALEVGRSIETSALEIREHEGFPLGADVAVALEAVAGRAPRRKIQAGADILISNLTEPIAIHRGDPVEVEVRSGQARLRFTGQAQASARSGEQVQVENPTTHRRFTARVVAPGKAVLTLGGPTAQASLARQRNP